MTTQETEAAAWQGVIDAARVAGFHNVAAIAVEAQRLVGHVNVALSPDECRALRDTIALRISFLEAHRRTFKDYELQAVFEAQMNDLEALNRRIGDALWEFRKKGYDAAQKADGHVCACDHS